MFIEYLLALRRVSQFCPQMQKPICHASQPASLSRDKNLCSYDISLAKARRPRIIAATLLGEAGT
jgi:hypothetical protein